MARIFGHEGQAVRFPPMLPEWGAEPPPILRYEQLSGTWDGGCRVEWRAYTTDGQPFASVEYHRYADGWDAFVRGECFDELRAFLRKYGPR